MLNSSTLGCVFFYTVFVYMIYAGEKCDWRAVYNVMTPAWFETADCGHKISAFIAVISGLVRDHNF